MKYFQSFVDAKHDAIILTLCGFSVSRSAKETSRVLTKEQIHQLRQTGQEEIYIENGNFLFNRNGPRVLESAGKLLEAINLPMR